MNNNILLSYFVNILPKLTLAFVAVLLFYKLYITIRSKYNIKVNCWFCNTNSKVPYSEANSWTCKSCDQYNGFTKDGDYNREIKEQFDCSFSKANGNINASSNQWFYRTNPQNGFCDVCNEAQRLKIEKISQFEPKKESRFDAELKVYKAQLEQQYRLCATCERHLRSVLRNKKKMVLGTKFLEYIMKSAEAIKDPRLSSIRLAQQLIWKRRLTFIITILTLINVCCLTGLLPDLNRIWFVQNFGDFFGSQVFIACSHLNAFWRVIISYSNTFMENETAVRFGLFVRTIFMMLLYSLGLRLPQIVRLNFISIYLLTAPFCILATIFSYNVIDKFKLTRYTVLLVLWSIYAGGLLEQSSNNVQQILMFAASILTTFLTCTSKIETSPKLYDRTANSFHKIYNDDDYASELDTATSSILSYQLNNSSPSGQSDISHSFSTLKQRSNLRSLERTSPLSSSTLSLNLTPRPATLLTNLQNFNIKTPITSSTYSLNQTPRSTTTATTSRSFYQNNNNIGTMDNSFYSTKSINSNHDSTPRSHTLNPILNSTFIVQQNPFINDTNSTKFNSSFMTANLNNSFSSVNGSFHTQTPSIIESCRSPFNNQFNTHLRQHETHMPAPSLRSAYSASTTALHNLERPLSRLLSPSRFSFNNQTINFVDSRSNPSNLSNPPSIFEQPNRNLSSMTLCPINENLSRASSRSSGFESQNDHLNNSRENSFGNSEIDKTILPEKGFQPLNHHKNFNHGIDNTFSLLSLQQPLSVNCGGSNNNSSIWQTNKNTSLFNQTSIKRGDLLRKWKDNTVMN